MQPVQSLEMPLSEGWRFALDVEDAGEARGWQSDGFDDRNWEPVCVPHTWNTGDRSTDYEGIAWYRLAFPCPPGSEAGEVRLRFEAVFYLARVWLNGEYLGEHEGGYTPFEFVITRYVRTAGQNNLAVRVDNRRGTDRLPAHLFEGHSYGWNNYGGIVREVKLLVSSKVYVDAVRVIATPHLTSYDEADGASVSTHVSIRNASDEPFSGWITQDILEDASGRAIAGAIQSVGSPPSTSIDCALKTSFENPLLWHFDHPNLYRCVTTLKDASGIEYHRAVTTFGIREVDWHDGQLRLNGEPVRLAGLSRHADVPGYGLAESIPMMTRDFDDLKSLNMVFGRPVHYPQDRCVYDYCDRKGILLCPELPAWQLTAGQMADEHMRLLARQQLAEMIGGAANHACIWAWSVGNELESDTVAGRAYVKEMVALVRSLDPTRPAGFASYHLLVGRPWGDATTHADFVMMNEYFGTWHGPKDSLGPALDTIHLTWPDKVLIISEFGFAPHWQRVEGPQRIDPDQYYHIAEHADGEGTEADCQRELVISDQMAVFRSKPFVSGAVFWAYRGAMGVVDEQGRRRSSWETLREEFAPVVIGGIEFLHREADQWQINVSLRVRGPIEQDMPAYIIRGYRLAWELLSPTGESLAWRDETSLPTLPPGIEYSASIDMPDPASSGQLRIYVIRPTGFIVTDRVFPIPEPSEE